MNKNIIAFQKGIIVVPNSGIDNRNLAMMVQAELMRFGHMLDQDAFTQLGQADAADIKDFHNEVIDYLKRILGADKDYLPFYKGFPEQVMATSERELWFDRIMSYWTHGAFTGKIWDETKKSAFESINYKMIRSGTEKDFEGIFTTLAKSGQSLTPTDLSVLEWFVANYPFLVFPDTVPFKENLCTMIGKLITTGRGLGTVQLPSLTTTDVLRIIVYLSGGDVSLPKVPRKMIRNITWGGYRRSVVLVTNPDRDKFKFKKFPRSERRLILELLEKSNLDVKEMKLKVQRWIKVGGALHPGEYATQFPRTAKAFDLLRNHKVTSWYGEVTKAFGISANAGITKLAERPGEFLRKLDFLIRTANTSGLQLTLNTLAKIGAKASNKVLFETYYHFEERRVPNMDRKIMIKGARKHTKLPSLAAIAAEKIDAVQATIFDILKGKFAELPALGDCWIDEELKKIPMPANMRSMSEALVPIVRGQRTPLGKVDKTLRAYLLCPNKRHTGMCIDLSSITTGKNGARQTCDFTHLKVNDLILHSGDSYGRTGDVSEFIDFDLKKLKEAGYKYSLIQLNNYHRNPELVDNCTFGFSEIEFPNNNRIWQPDTVVASFKVKIPGKVNLLLIDLESGEYILLDEDGDDTRFVNMVNASDIEAVIKSYAELPKVSVYDLLLWHVEARGRVVSKETAETHFLFEDFSSSYVKTIEFMGV